MKKQKDRGKTELEKKLEKEAAEQAAAEAAKSAEKKTEEQKTEAEENPDIAKLAAERDEARDQLLRTMADYDNYRKRLARENERTRKLAAEAIVRDLLPVLDNLERAVDHAGADAGPLAEGVQMVLDQFRAVLEKHGLKKIPALNEPFDPNVHEAVMQAESTELPPDHVVQEFEKGYTLGDYILRPSKVVVSKSAEPAETAEPEAEPGGVDTAQTEK